jgi:hypothetical protein
MVGLEFDVVEFMISSLRGVHPHENGSLSKQRSCWWSILQLIENKKDGWREIDCFWPGRNSPAGWWEAKGRVQKLLDRALGGSEG